jgi:hypothetical protein
MTRRRERGQFTVERRPHSHALHLVTVGEHAFIAGATDDAGFATFLFCRRPSTEIQAAERPHRAAEPRRLGFSETSKSITPGMEMAFPRKPEKQMDVPYFAVPTTVLLGSLENAKEPIGDARQQDRGRVSTRTGDSFTFRVANLSHNLYGLCV